MTVCSTRPTTASSSPRSLVAICPSTTSAWIAGPRRVARLVRRGDEVLRSVDSSGAVRFAGTGYRVGNRYIGETVGVRLLGDTVQITLDGALVRTHRARHDKSKEFGALAQPNGKPRRNSGVA